MKVTDFNSAKLESLRRRAHDIDTKIIVGSEVNEDLPPECRGPYTLVCAQTGYWAHVPGVNLASLEKQIEQIEKEFRTGTGLFALEAVEDPFAGSAASLED